MEKKNANGQVYVWDNELAIVDWKKGEVFSYFYQSSEKLLNLGQWAYYHV